MDNSRRLAIRRAHAKHCMYCTCGKVVHGNGGKANHRDMHRRRNDGHRYVTEDAWRALGFRTQRELKGSTSCGPFTVWTRQTEDEELVKRGSFKSLDDACADASEAVDCGSWEAIVRDAAYVAVQIVGR